MASALQPCGWMQDTKHIYAAVIRSMVDMLTLKDAAAEERGGYSECRKSDILNSIRYRIRKFLSYLQHNVVNSSSLFPISICVRFFEIFPWKRKLHPEIMIPDIEMILFQITPPPSYVCSYRRTYPHPIITCSSSTPGLLPLATQLHYH